jgi:hypothetical protein
MGHIVIRLLNSILGKLAKCVVFTDGFGVGEGY